MTNKNVFQVHYERYVARTWYDEARWQKVTCHCSGGIKSALYWVKDIEDKTARLKKRGKLIGQGRKIRIVKYALAPLSDAERKMVVKRGSP